MEVRGGAQAWAQTGPTSLIPLPHRCCPARFVCKNNGVLFENQLLQIGVKSEFRQNLGASGQIGELVGGWWRRTWLEWRLARGIQRMPD